MANLDGANFKKAFVDKPSEKIDAGDQNGRLRVAYEEYDLDTLGVVVAAGDIIRGPRLPKGCRVHNAYVESPSMGATGIFDLGWADVVDDSGTVIDAADQNGFVDQADAGGQAVLKSMRDTLGSAGQYKRFTEEVPVQIECTEVTVAITGVIKLSIEYSVE
jgi:hypothetical protein